MKKYTIVSLLLIFSLSLSIRPVRAQQWLSTRGLVSFDIKSPVGGMQAANDSIFASLDQKTGALTYSVRVRGFQFNTPRLSERINAITTYRFHEYYFQTDDYQDALFEGRIEGLNHLDLKRPGMDTLGLTGVLTLHGTSQKINTLACIQKEQDEVRITFSTTIDPADFGVRIPLSIARVYFNEVEITVTCGLKKKG